MTIKSLFKNIVLRVIIIIALAIFIFLIIELFIDRKEIGIIHGQGIGFLSRLKRVTTLTAEKIKGYDLSLKEAMWYKKLADGDVQCTLCPINCIIPEGRRGKCRVRANIGGKLRALTYGKPAVVSIHPIEKELFFHCLPGACTVIVATVGCNLDCTFCQNWSLSQASPEQETHSNMSPQQLVEFTKQQGCKTIAFGLAEPVVFYEYMYETAKIAHAQGLKVLWKTGGYINPEPIRELSKYVDMVNIDIKGFTQDFYDEYCDGDLQAVLTAIKTAKEEMEWVEISYLVIPGANDTPKEIRDACRWIKQNLGEDTPLYFTRFIPNYKLADRPPTPYKTLKMAYDIAVEEGLKYVYIIIVPGNRYEDTYCPSCGKKIIDREGFWTKESHIKNGKCEYCGEKIWGLFK